LLQCRQDKTRIEPARKRAEDAPLERLGIRPDRREQPVAMGGEPVEHRHGARRLGKRLGRVVQPHPVRTELGHPVRPEHLQLGEHRIVADRHDVERKFVDALPIERHIRQRFERRQERCREDPPLRIVEELERAEKVGEQARPPSRPHQRHELPADPAPVGPIGHVEQGLQRRPPEPPVAAQRPRHRDQIVAPHEQALRPADDVGRMEQPPPGQRVLAQPRKAVPRELPLSPRQRGLGEFGIARRNEEQPGHARALPRHA
jgi:hypothetical protein